MNTKMLKEAFRTGQVDYIQIEQTPDNGTFLFAIMRNPSNRFLLARYFTTAVSALKFVEKLIQLPILGGLNDDYSRPPYINILIRR